VAVPTPVDSNNEPNHTSLIDASVSIGKHMKRGAIVVYEATVYPGATEELCVPLLEQASGFTHGDGFNVAYSPERINPGDNAHTLTTVVKVVAGDTAETLSVVDELYSSVVPAGTCRVSSIKVAEMAKMIENVQRDVNIALMNDVAIMCNRFGIDTSEVLGAAGTKWNFLPFVPGLVGGHCVSVDPYYLIHKARTVGCQPRMIDTARAVNNDMINYVADQIVDQLGRYCNMLEGGVVVMLGLAFKENCGDMRNSGAVGVVKILQARGLSVVGHEPLASASDIARECNISVYTKEQIPRPTHALIFAVAHDEYQNWTYADIKSMVAPGGLVADIKGVLSHGVVTALRANGIRVWRL
jgi:UDP-N-acetyl-D-galactosamine dehydrogenase